MPVVTRLVARGHQVRVVAGPGVRVVPFQDLDSHPATIDDLERVAKRFGVTLP